MIQFISDRVKISGPLINGDVNVTFSTGEYAWDQIKDLPNLNGAAIYVTVKTKPETKGSDKEDSRR